MCQAIVAASASAFSFNLSENSLFNCASPSWKEDQALALQHSLTILLYTYHETSVYQSRYLDWKIEEPAEDEDLHQHVLAHFEHAHSIPLFAHQLTNNQASVSEENQQILIELLQKIKSLYAKVLDVHDAE